MPLDTSKMMLGQAQQPHMATNSGLNPSVAMMNSTVPLTSSFNSIPAGPMNFTSTFDQSKFMMPQQSVSVPNLDYSKILNSLLRQQQITQQQPQQLTNDELFKLASVINALQLSQTLSLLQPSSLSLSPEVLQRALLMNLAQSQVQQFPQQQNADMIQQLENLRKLHGTLPTGVSAVNPLGMLQGLNPLLALQQSLTSSNAVPRFAANTQATSPPLPVPSKKRAPASDDDTESTSSSGTPKVKRERLDLKPTADDNSDMGLGGESRLKISFTNLGSAGKHPQVFGKSRLGVPDGLSGTYVLYSERWKSEILHENESFESPDGTKHVLITWKITNLTSGMTQSRTETPKEAVLRHKDGRTLCNKVFRRALEQRAQDLERDLTSETNLIRVKTMKNLIKKLRPKHFSEGPLVFGLRHESVQNRFKSMTELSPSGHLVAKQC